MADALDEGLHVVVPHRGGTGILHAGDKHGADVVNGQELALDVRQVRARDRLVVAVEHQAGDLVYRQLRGQVPGPVLRALAPVLVDIEFTIPVQVLESVSSLSEYFHPGAGAVAQHGAVLLMYKVVTVLLFDGPVLRAAGQQDDARKGQKKLFHSLS